MGFIKAFSGALGGTFADQWKDFYAPKAGVSSTAAVFQAVPQSQNNGRGENYKGNENIISNGSKIVVPEGTALITLQDGQITGFIAEPGGFEFRSDDPNSQSMFAGDGIFGQTIKSTWEKVKFGGQAGSQQLAFYINLKEIPNNKFGTQSEIYWDDAFFGTQVGAVTRGTYTLKIVDPLLFVKNFVPAKYLQPNAPVFDFADMDNDAGSQLFNEVVGSLSAAVEEGYQWKSDRGLEIVKTAILAIEYDEDTKELMKDVKKADALSGARGNSFMQQAAARGMQAAGENGGGSGMAFMGMGANAAGGMMGAMQQPNNGSAYQPAFGGTPQVGSQSEINKPTTEDPTDKLLNAKKLLDAGAISQEDYDKIKIQTLGL